MSEKPSVIAEFFFDSLELELGNASEEETPKGFSVSQQKLLQGIISDGREFIYYGEWFVALEITLENLFEIDFKISEKTLILAKKAILKSKQKIRIWNDLDELIRKS